MTYRITRNHLEAQLAQAAHVTGWDIAQPIWTQENGHNSARVGAVFIEHNTYSGYKLCQMVGPGGGERVIFQAANAREMNAYLRGVIKGGETAQPATVRPWGQAIANQC